MILSSMRLPLLPLAVRIAVGGHLGIAPAAADGAIVDPINYFDMTDEGSREGYESWLASPSTAGRYPMHAFLPAASDDGAGGEGAAVFWSLRLEDRRIEFAIAVRAVGWLGFGLSQAGGMIGSDVFLFRPENATEVIDSHVVDEYAAPLVDGCQDWKWENATMTDDGWTIVEASRALDTGDPQDWPIVDDSEPWTATTRLIAAWGDSPDMGYHGVSKARRSVRLFAEAPHTSESAALERVLAGQSGGLYFEVREDEYKIPARETKYRRVCRTAEELGINGTEGGITLIGAVPVITEETRWLVHHFTVFSLRDCDSFFPRSLVYMWAPGHQGWALPEHIGFPMFHSPSYMAVEVEIHYDNPALREGLLDSSGVRFYYTDDERDEKAAILELGDPLVTMRGESINEGLTKYQFTCPGECSANSGDTVTVVNEYLHMHRSGVRMTNEVIRNDEVVHTAAVDVYAFEQQGGFHVPQQQYKLLPGDGFRTTCYYRDGGEFGLGSNDEMCIAYVMYYPAKQIAGNPWMCPAGDFISFLGSIGCKQELEFSDVAGSEGLRRSFGASGECSNDSLSRAPTESPTTAAPTISPAPTPNLKPCSVCPSGITADADYIVPNTRGSTCDEAIAFVKSTVLENMQSCTLMKTSLEQVCCPTPLANVVPCAFCPEGVTQDESFVIPGAPNEETCGFLNEFAPSLDVGSESCPLVQAAEIVCCPPRGGVESDEVANSCSFCPNGITLEEEFVIPGAPNGETCGCLVEIAPTLADDSENCSLVRTAEFICCPLQEEITASPTGNIDVSTDELTTGSASTIVPSPSGTLPPTVSPEAVINLFIDVALPATKDPNVLTATPTVDSAPSASNPYSGDAPLPTTSTVSVDAEVADLSGGATLQGISYIVTLALFPFFYDFA